MRHVLFLMMALTVMSAPALMCETIQTDAPAYQSKGTVMVPMRAIFEWLGAVVSFDSATGWITATRGEQVVSLKPGDRTATVNGEKKTMSTPAEGKAGRTFVPVRFVAEAFGAAVAWDQQTNVVSVEDGDRRGTIHVGRPPRSAESSAVKTPKSKQVRVSDGKGGYWDFAGTCDPGLIKKAASDEHGWIGQTAIMSDDNLSLIHISEPTRPY